MTEAEAIEIANRFLFNDRGVKATAIETHFIQRPGQPKSWWVSYGTAVLFPKETAAGCTIDDGDYILKIDEATGKVSLLGDIPTTQRLVDELNQQTATADFAIRCLSHEIAIVRVNAIEALGRLTKDHEQAAVSAIAKAAADPKNNVRLLGTTTVGHVAIAVLLRIGSEAAIENARESVQRIPREQVEDLAWYLNSEGLKADAIGL